MASKGSPLPLSHDSVINLNLKGQIALVSGCPKEIDHALDQPLKLSTIPVFPKLRITDIGTLPDYE